MSSSSDAPLTWSPDPASSEASFSSLQLVDAAVQEPASTVPGCCTRTALSVSQPERSYILRLPLQGSLPNESPDRPVQNRLKLVMADVRAPALQVVGGVEERSAEIILSASGPRECPPGRPSTAVVEGPGGGAQAIPFTGWTWRAPAVLDPALLESGDALPDLLHPLQAPDLPAQRWEIRVPACGGAGSRLAGWVQAFPDVRWSGRLTLRAEAEPATRRGYRMVVDSTLTCSYSGAQRVVRTVEEALRICPLLEGVELMARTAAGVMALTPRAGQRGLDDPRLERGVLLEWNPWPALSVDIRSQLTGEPASGLVGHQMEYRVEGTAFMGARGGRSMLPLWLEDQAWRRRLSPVLAGMGTERTEDICQECGIWLRAEGQTGFTAGLSVDRPSRPVESRAQTHGAVDLWLEGRCGADSEGLLLRSGTPGDLQRPGTIYARCEAPPSTPLPDPRDHVFQARIACEGLAFAGVEKYLPGLRIRAWHPPDEPAPGPVEIIPARRWPTAGEPGKLSLIPLSPA